MGSRRIPLWAGVAAMALGCAGPVRAQATIEVLSAPVIRTAGLGTGGGTPSVQDRASSPTGRSVDGLQPASYVEWRVACSTPGVYRIGLSLSQWLDAGSALAFETRPLTQPEDPYVTRYATPDTRDYGQTLGAWAFWDLGDAQDAAGNALTVPLWAGDNVFRVQNVTGRHNPAYSYPTDLSNPRNRDWDLYWSDVHLGRIILTRVADPPPTGTMTGRVTGNRPPGTPVRRALVLANPPGASPPEPSHFWKNGYYTLSRDDGTYTLTVPAGPHDVKAGRPSSYQVQGSPVAPVNVTTGGTTSADLALTSIFHDDGSGAQVAEVQTTYFDDITGAMAILPVDGENGYKMGWVDAGDTASMIVDAPRTGHYRVASSYFNGGNDGTVRVSADTGTATEAPQPNSGGWDSRGFVVYAQPIFLRQGPNVVSQTLLAGNSDQDSIHLTAPPVTMNDAARALRIAAGLAYAGTLDNWQGTLTGGPEITLADAVRILQAVHDRPL